MQCGPCRSKTPSIVRIGPETAEIPRDLKRANRGLSAGAGRAIQTVYPASYADQISIFDFGMRPGTSPFARPDCASPEPECARGDNPGRTYRFFTGQAAVSVQF